ncbi:helix-turn-helix domain-containing protein [Burkholderia ubonensis]|uniref:helix-turn-helix domain-containing protein n=1 Tax=Burkholderia ubonensis TaxID=101571 RepID=UPI000F576105|nr:helix-turn-helix transcriptional regulator [Burkholderia ubonensis]RQP36500.1 XRE family transcriptional regulator [Burkholderia ubonensis]RQP46669.1 XRE family transcriptional regulator [Burkholderia ubonensis]RQP47610.1 XRE family transcriptional regulator [Burkholderia ubonensis]RQP61645.1 XRE family transcriptional regulator [Burkholderia ubonensis]RQP61898.1 XRE family transcriptional regulator [Burkholderia ubonensis]
MNTPIPKKQLTWQLDVMMAKRRIRTNVELHRRLRDIGYEISSAQLGRLVEQQPPPRLNTELLCALMTVLDCEVHDLLVPPAPLQDNADTRALSAVSERVRSVASEPPPDVTGPKVKALPEGPRR